MKKKLALRVDGLRVESFATARTEAYRGTVGAHMVSQGANTCYCTSINIGCFCTEQMTPCFDCA